MAKIFDVSDVTAQIDVLRKHLRSLYMRDGPVPPDLAADHDMGWDAREAERLKAEAESAEAHVEAMKAAEAARAKDAGVVVSPLDEATARAKSLREEADAAAAALNKSPAKAESAKDEPAPTASGVAAQKWGEGFKGSNRDPNAPKPASA